MAAAATGYVYLRRSKRGPDKWYAKYRIGDRQMKKCLGPAASAKGGRPVAGTLTRRQAEAELDAILTDARRGLTVVSGATFADAAAEYLRYVEEVRQIGSKTLADYRGVIDGYLLEEFGEKKIEAITPTMIESYRDGLLEGKLSNRTIIRHLTVLHGIFKRAKRVWGLPDNPASAEMVERPKMIYTGEFDTFDRAEIDRLVGAAENPVDAALYQAAAFTGLRTGELLALRWKHVDFVGGLIHVRRNFTGGEEKNYPKGKRVRSVPMMPDVIDTLGKLKEREHFTDDDDLVFCSEVGDHLNYFDHLKRYKATLKRAGLRAIRFHDLRHAFGTAAIQKLDPFAVQSYMGHQHYSTTQRYLHHKPRREDAAALAEAFVVPNVVPKSDDPTATEGNSEGQSVPETTERVDA